MSQMMTWPSHKEALTQKSTDVLSWYECWRRQDLFISWSDRVAAFCWSSSHAARMNHLFLLLSWSWFKHFLLKIHFAGRFYFNFMWLYQREAVEWRQEMRGERDKERQTTKAPGDASGSRSSSSWEPLVFAFEDLFTHLVVFYYKELLQ